MNQHRSIIAVAARTAAISRYGHSGSGIASAGGSRGQLRIIGDVRAENADVARKLPVIDGTALA